MSDYLSSTQEDINYWESKFNGFDHLHVALPQQQRIQDEKPSINQICLSLDSCLSKKLLSYSDNENTNTFILLTSSFSALCQLFSDQTEIVFNYTNKISKDVLGSFCLKFDNEIGFNELVTMVRTQWNKDISYQNIPFASSHPKLNLLFCEGSYLLSDNFKYDLVFSYRSDNENIHLSIQYRTALYNKEFIDEFLNTFSIFVKDALDHPHNSIKDINLLDEKVYQRIIYDWNDTSTHRQPTMMLLEQFKRKVHQYPNHTALIYQNKMLSYHELDSLSNIAASNLIHQYGITKGTIIGLCCERSLETIVAILAIFKAGAIYLPIDPTYPISRINFLIDDSKSALILTLKRHIEFLQAESCAKTVISIEDILVCKNSEATSFHVQTRLDDLCYLIYTSGTTGQPKGVLNHYRGLQNRLDWMIEMYDFNCDDTFLQKTSLCFDISIWEILIPLLTGARLAIAKPGSQKEPRKILEQIIAYHVTVIHFVPSMLKAFLDFYNPSITTPIRLMGATGEALSYQTVRLFNQKFPQAKLLNLYGPTEASIEVSFWDCSQHKYPGIIPIGYPISNVKLYILDEKLQPVPLGKMGELYIGGIAVAKGYLYRPELNKERFINNPFLNDGSTLYKTGDICKWIGPRCVEYVGRNDQQIKLKGHRIELSEIEFHLMSHADVKYCVVCLHQLQDRQIILAFLIINNSKVDEDTLRHYLSECVPSYMLPNKFCFVDVIPTTNQGKVDYRALQTYLVNEQLTDIEIPTTKITTDATIQSLWAQILGISFDKINGQSNFFSLGGDSLTALRIISALEEQHNCEIPIQSLLEYPTLSDFTAWLLQHLNEQQCKTIITKPIETIPVAEEMALYQISATQKILLSSKNNNFVVPFSWKGHLNIDRFQQAFKKLIERHKLIHANFIINDNTWSYYFNTNKEYLEIHDIQHLDDQSWNAYIINIQKELLTQSINLNSDSLFFVKVFCETPNDYVLLFYFNHLIVDRTSMQLILSELLKMYEADMTPIDKELPQTFQYHEYVKNEMAILESSQYQSQLNYWLTQLAHKQRNILTEKPRELISSVCEFYQENFNSDINDAIDGLVKTYQKTPFCVLVTNFSRVLSQFLNQNEFAIGFTISKRYNIRYENTIGPIINFCSLQCDTTKKMQLPAAMQHMENLILGAYKNCDIPSVDVLNAVRQVENNDVNQLFDVLFDFDPVPFDMHNINNVALSALPIIHSQHMQRYITVRVNKNKTKYNVEVRFRSELFSSQDIASLIKLYQQTLLDEYIHKQSLYIKENCT